MLSVLFSGLNSSGAVRIFQVVITEQFLLESFDGRVIPFWVILKPRTIKVKQSPAQNRKRAINSLTSVK